MSHKRSLGGCSFQISQHGFMYQQGVFIIVIVFFLPWKYEKTLCPESSENIPILFQVSDLCFENQNCIRNPKIGSEQSITGAPWFQKTIFWHQKSSKKLDVLLIFEFLWQYIYEQFRPVLKNLITGLAESVEILPKC